MSLVLLTTIRKKLLAFFHAQLFVSLISLPILICWGLPLSSMTIVGNLVFTPFLTLFLLLCTFFFFTELLGIPNGLIVNALEYFCYFWSWCIHCGSSSWLLHFIQPNYLVLIFIVVAAFTIVQLKNATTHHQIAGLVLLAGISGLYLSFLCPPTSYCARLPHNDGDLFILHHNRQTVIIDPGLIARSGNASSWLEHTLIKELTTHLGTSTIHHLILLQPSPRVFEATAKLCELTSVERVYLPIWHGRLEGDHHFFIMKCALESTGGKLIRIKNEMLLSLDQEAYVRITPQKKFLQAGPISYPVMHAEGCVGERKIMTASVKSFTT